MQIEQYVLRAGKEQDAIRQAYIHSFFKDASNEIISSKDSCHDIDANTFGRYNRTVKKVIPWIQRVFDLRGSRVLEIGSGTGSSGVALANVADDVFGVEPKGRCLEVACKRVQIMGLRNIRFVQSTSPEIFEQLDKDFPPPFDVVMLSAVLEHQTIPERIQTIRHSWECLRPGGIMVVAESPNRLTYMDGHTSRLMFYDMLETELALRVFSLSPRKAFVRVLQTCANTSWQAAQEMLIRRGRGICHYDFDAALPGRPYRILADGYEPEPLEAFGITYEERLLQSCIANNNLDIPSVFQRHTIYGIFQKPDANATPQTHLNRRFSPLVATREDINKVIELIQDGEYEKAQNILRTI